MQNLDLNASVSNTGENQRSRNQEDFSNGGNYNRNRYARQGYSSAEGPAVAEGAANTDNTGNNTASTNRYRAGDQE